MRGPEVRHLGMVLKQVEIHSCRFMSLPCDAENRARAAYERVSKTLNDATQQTALNASAKPTALPAPNNELPKHVQCSVRQTAVVWHVHFFDLPFRP